MGEARKRADAAWNTDEPERPATTRERRQARMEDQALKLIEKRFKDGTASAQETTLFAKSATTRGRIEELRLRAEVDLMKAKKSHLESQEQLQEMFKEAVAAMGAYRFEEPGEDRALEA